MARKYGSDRNEYTTHVKNDNHYVITHTTHEGSPGTGAGNYLQNKPGLIFATLQGGQLAVHEVWFGNEKGLFDARIEQYQKNWKEFGRHHFFDGLMEECAVSSYVTFTENFANWENLPETPVAVKDNPFYKDYKSGRYDYAF